MCRWDELPQNMQVKEVKRYYDILQRHKASLILKRLFDIIVAGVLLVLLSPLLLILAVCIKLDSKGPVFFRQVRVTTYGKSFRIFKFRTMVNNADKIGTQVTTKGDTRITKVGKALRGCRLDELPQLLNILSGDMTFVGTRPEVEKYVAHYTDEMKATLLLPAGVTSRASIEYKDEDTVCGVVRNIGRDMESSKILTLGQLKEYNADMFTTVFIGNKSTVRMGEKMVTPRGYNNKSQKSIIIFAGTTEGRHLADYASGLNIDTHIFVATEYGEMILKDDKSFNGNKCIIHTGRLDEAEIKEEIEKINPMAVFDATHPFAVQVTENIKNACEKTTTKYIRIKRDKENYNLVNREKVRSAGSAEEAAIILSAPCYKNKKVLLTTGSKTVGIYSHLEGFKDNYYLRMLPNVQMLGEVLKSGIKNSNVICMQGPFSENMNYEMIKNYGIEVMVTKNSGNTGGTQEKINAAMRAGTEVIIIEDTGSDECIGIGLSEALKYITEIVEK